MKSVCGEFYDRGWDLKWTDMKRYGPFSRHLRRILKDVIRPLRFESVLDVGCGEGSFLAELQKEFPAVKLSGIDVSSSAIAAARELVPGGVFEVVDILGKPLNEKFDLVVCSEVLEHLSDDVAAIKNLRQMTSKYLLVSAPQGRMREFETDFGHVRNYERGELVAKLEANGFAVIRVVEWGFPFYSPVYRNILELIRARGTAGHFGTIRKIVAWLTYLLFTLNSARKGDEIVVLARPLDR